MPLKQQTSHDTDIILHNNLRTRVGQKLILSNYVVSDLSFLIRKVGTPDDVDIAFTIRKVSDDSIIISKVLTTAQSLQTTGTWEKVTFLTPVVINEEVRILVEGIVTSGSQNNDNVMVRYWANDIVANEIMDWYPTGGPWSGGSGGIYDCTYKFNYTTGAGGGAPIIFPAEAITRVTNIIHRYNRAEQVYTMECSLGEVTSDFGLPEWLSKPIAITPDKASEPVTAGDVEKIIDTGTQLPGMVLPEIIEPTEPVVVEPVVTETQLPGRLLPRTGFTQGTIDVEPTLLESLSAGFIGTFTRGVKELFINIFGGK